MTRVPGRGDEAPAALSAWSVEGKPREVTPGQGLGAQSLFGFGL